MKQYALIKDNQVVIEGALPYFWSESPDVPKYDMLSFTDEELNGLGWFEIVEEGKLNTFDTEIQYVTAKPIEIINGVPVRRWEYPFLNGVKSIFLQRNLRLAEQYRQMALTEFPGQSIEYDFLVKEAEGFIDNSNPDVTLYPLLFSTIQQDLPLQDRIDLAKIEAAKVLSKRNDTIRLLALVREKRKSIEQRILLDIITPTDIIEFEKEWANILQSIAGLQPIE